MSRCSNGVVDGVIDGLVIGFVVGATLCFFRSCQGRAVGPMINEGFRWAGSGAVFFGALGAIRNCL